MEAASTSAVQPLPSAPPIPPALPPPPPLPTDPRGRSRRPTPSTGHPRSPLLERLPEAEDDLSSRPPAPRPSHPSPSPKDDIEELYVAVARPLHRRPLSAPLLSIPSPLARGRHRSVPYPPTMRKSVVPDVNAHAQEELLKEDSGDSQLNPYTWERPLDTVNRHSRMLDLSPPVALKADHRRSRLPQFDPFGFSVADDMSSYDAALAYSARPLRPLTNNFSSSSSLTTTLGSASAATSPATTASSDSLFWQQKQRRSASYGDIAALGNAGPRNSSFHGGGGSPRLGMGPSKLSGEIRTEPDSPTPPASLADYIPSDKDYINSKLYQRTLKAQKALEKERARSQSRSPSGPASTDPHASNRLTRVFSDIGGGSASSKKSAARKSLGWFRSASEVALPLPSMVHSPSDSPPLPSSHSVSHLGLDRPQRPFSSRPPARASPPPPPPPPLAEPTRVPSPAFNRRPTSESSTASQAGVVVVPSTAARVRASRRPTSRPSSTTTLAQQFSASSGPGSAPPTPTQRKTPSPSYDHQRERRRSRTSSGGSRRAAAAAAQAVIEAPLPPSPLLEQEFVVPLLAPLPVSPPPPSEMEIEPEMPEGYGPPIVTPAEESRVAFPVAGALVSKPLRTSSVPQTNGNGETQPPPPSAGHTDAWQQPYSPPATVTAATYQNGNGAYAPYEPIKAEQWLAPPPSVVNGPSLPPGAAPPEPRKRRGSTTLLFGGLRSGRRSDDEREEVAAWRQQQARAQVVNQAQARAQGQPSKGTQEDRTLAASAPPADHESQNSAPMAPSSAGPPPSKRSALSKSAKEKEKGFFARARKTFTASSEPEQWHSSQTMRESQLPPAVSKAAPPPPALQQPVPAARPLKATVPPPPPSLPSKSKPASKAAPPSLPAVSAKLAKTKPTSTSFFTFGRSSRAAKASSESEPSSSSSSWMDSLQADGKSLPPPPPLSAVPIAQQEQLRARNGATAYA